MLIRRRALKKKELCALLFALARADPRYLQRRSRLNQVSMFALAQYRVSRPHGLRSEWVEESAIIGHGAVVGRGLAAKGTWGGGFCSLWAPAWSTPKKPVIVFSDL